MSVCCVIGCKNNYNNSSSVQFYRFPIYKRTHDKTMQIAFLQQRMAWISALKNRSTMTIKNIRSKRICSSHFVSGVKASCLEKHSPNWVPSLGLTCKKPKTTALSEDALCDSIQANDIKSNELEFDPTLIRSETSEIMTLVESINTCNETVDIAKGEIPVNLDIDVETYIANLRCIIQTQEKLIADLKMKLLKYNYDVQSFRNDNFKTRYYTGLPEFVTLETLYARIEPYIQRYEQNVLTKSQMLILTLMKLRLGLHFTDLSYRFNISIMTASRTFYHVIDVLYYRLKNLVFVPEREDIKLTMPEVFKKNFGDDIVYIIDCTEIFIEMPSNSETSVQCFSFYKKHHTVKFLLAISPQGAIVFVSKLFGGRASDIHITNKSGFLNILLPNDYVLGDKGFKMEDVFEMKQANLKIPAFVYKQQQLHPLKIEQNRRIANVRIHVERIIGLLKRKFTLLHHIIPMSMLSKKSSTDVSVLDKIINICSALCNLCPPIVGSQTTD